MRTIITFLVLFASILACTTQKSSVAKTESKPTPKTVASKNDTVRISNDSLEYEVIIIDPGFTNWMASHARPRSFYTQSFLESRNVPWVVQWNINARSVVSARDPNLYPMEIDYRNGTNYGFEVNYMLFNYLTYFQLTNNVRLGGPIPRI